MKTRWTLAPHHPRKVVCKLINTIYPASQIFQAKKSWFILSLLRQKPFDSLDCLVHFSLPFISDSSFFSARLIRITVVEQLKPDAKERGRKDMKWEDPRNIFLVSYWLGRGRIIAPELRVHRHSESHIQQRELCFQTFNAKPALKSLAYNIKAMKLNHTAPPVLAFVDQECWVWTVPQPTLSLQAFLLNNCTIQGSQPAATASISPTNKEGKVSSMTRKAMSGK